MNREKIVIINFGGTEIKEKSFKKSNFVHFKQVISNFEKWKKKYLGTKIKIHLLGTKIALLIFIFLFYLIKINMYYNNYFKNYSN